MFYHQPCTFLQIWWCSMGSKIVEARGCRTVVGGSWQAVGSRIVAWAFISDCREELDFSLEWSCNYFHPGCDLFKRFSLEISYRHLVQIALQRDFAQQLLQRTCQGDLPHDLLQRSSQREFAGPGVSSARDHLEWTPCSTTRVALVLLACSHWWFWALSTFSLWNPSCRLLGVPCQDNFAIRFEVVVSVCFFHYGQAVLNFSVLFRYFAIGVFLAIIPFISALFLVLISRISSFSKQHWSSSVIFPNTLERSLPWVSSKCPTYFHFTMGFQQLLKI